VICDANINFTSAQHDTRPVAEIVTSAAFEDSHVALFVTSREVPSDIRAVADNWNDDADVEVFPTTTALTVVVGVGAVRFGDRRSFPHATSTIAQLVMSAATTPRRLAFPRSRCIIHPSGLGNSKVAATRRRSNITHVEHTPVRNGAIPNTRFLTGEIQRMQTISGAAIKSDGAFDKTARGELRIGRTEPRRSRRAPANPVFPHLAVQRRPIDTKPVRGFGLVPVCAFERLKDGHTFDVGERQIRRDNEFRSDGRFVAQ